MERSRRRRSPIRSLLAALATSAILLLLALVPAVAAPQDPTEPVSQEVAVSLEQRDVSVTPDGSFSITITTHVTVPTEYLEVRLRIFNPSGSLFYQKTEIRHDSEPGPVAISFGRQLTDLDLPEGRYPMEARILASDSDPTIMEDRMLVVRDDRTAVPVALVARFSCSPTIDPEGRFVVDPARLVVTRDDAVALSAVARAGRRPLAVALPPVMLRDWQRASSGYETVAPEGVRTVAEDSSISKAYADALDAIAASVDAGAFELLDVPYAEPDLAGLQAMVALEDLTEHYRQGSSTYQAVLGAGPVTGTAIRGDSLPAEATGILEERGLGFILLSQDALETGEETATPGAYAVTGTAVTALVIDETASGLLRESDPSGLVDHLFNAVMAQEDPAPLVIQMEFGPGTDGDVDRFSEVLDLLEGISWVRLSSCTEAATASEAREGSLPEQAHPGSPAPLGYWSEVLEARRLAMAFVAAAGETDPEAEAAFLAVLVSESRCWAGPDGSWGLADRGRAYAAAAFRHAQEVLASIIVSSEDVTLAGRDGKIPLSIENGSDRELTITIRADSEHARVGPPSSFEVTLRPAENFVTLPVTLTTALTDRIVISVFAGEIVIATTEVVVRASYLDRLTVVATVVLVLAALLFYIRRRAKRDRRTVMSRI